MANRKKKSRRNRNKKRNGAVGLLFLELIGVVAFAALLTTARGEREVAPVEQNYPPITITSTDQDGDDWVSRRPQFSQVVGDLWEAGF
jgi:hypothetical protein